MLLTCQAGFEALLDRELSERHAWQSVASGPGWVRTETGSGEGTSREIAAVLAQLAFAHRTLLAPIEVTGDSVNALARQLVDWFLASLQGERVAAEWPSVWLAPAEIVGLGRRVTAVETAFGESLRRRLSRVAKLAVPQAPVARGAARGLFVHFVDFGRAWVSRDGWMHGQRRMADDPLAPSRSYLKVEEAYGLLGREPGQTESVCDLGAAPGGWSFSAARRGARVVAVDNGPLKGGALDNPRIEHRCEDAFRFAPVGGARFDWLFCDLVEEPHHVLRDLVTPWLSQHWCRRFVVNLKFGRVDPVKLLAELHQPDSPLVRHTTGFHVSHLYHDREEFTVVGEVDAPALT